MLTTIIIANLIIGASIGISGIAGFMLPIIYTGLLGMPLVDALALSFVSFLASGLFGTYTYFRRGYIQKHVAGWLILASVIGSWAGVMLNMRVSVVLAKALLYLIVLFAGFSLIRKKDGDEPQACPARRSGTLRLFLVSLPAAAVSSLTGAGGPIILVPTLCAFGTPIRSAVGLSLMASIFIALPAAAGYMANATLDNIVLLAVVSFVTHSIGTLFGAHISEMVNKKALRLLVATLAIGASLYMLTVLLIF